MYRQIQFFVVTFKQIITGSKQISILFTINIFIWMKKITVTYTKSDFLVKDTVTNLPKHEKILSYKWINLLRLVIDWLFNYWFQSSFCFFICFTFCEIIGAIVNYINVRGKVPIYSMLQSSEYVFIHHIRRIFAVVSIKWYLNKNSFRYF